MADERITQEEADEKLAEAQTRLEELVENSYIVSRPPPEAATFEPGPAQRTTAGGAESGG